MQTPSVRERNPSCTNELASTFCYSLSSESHEIISPYTRQKDEEKEGSLVLCLEMEQTYPRHLYSITPTN